jgi:hypothetical protein
VMRKRSREAWTVQHVAYFLGIRCVRSRPPLVVDALQSLECVDMRYVPWMEDRSLI